MRLEDVRAFPLCWPDGWARTPAHVRDDGGRFGTMEQRPGETWRSKRPITFDRARRALRDELERLGALGVIMSTNAALRNDGEVRADAAEKRHTDPCIAVYFTLKGKQMVMAQDAFTSLAANAKSLSLAIDALRQLQRHGGGTMMERAFAGFTALPAPEGSAPKRAWWVVLNYSEDPDDRLDLSVEEVEARFRTLAKRRNYGHWTAEQIRDIVTGSAKEAHRVAKPDGLMAFKWNDHTRKLSSVLAWIDPWWEPLFGHGVCGQQRGKSMTSWVMLRRRQDGRNSELTLA